VKNLQAATLLASTMTVGLMAGVFGLYAHAIMPGLGRTDDRTFVGAFQAIDRAILNPWFVPVFVGALIFTGASAALHLTTAHKPVAYWIIAASILYLIAFVITIGIHVPLNDAIKAAGDPDRIADLAAVRRRFETKWVQWNIVRAVTSTLAFGCLVSALLQSGRA
jgi:uncharacterized membrane protein